MIDAGRAIASLRELDRRTGGEKGARRVCWTPVWAQARELLAELLEGFELETDAAGNLWAELAGGSDELVVIGSHLDSVPAGGWLDGALGVMAAVEVLRACAGSGERPPCSVAFVDWADEEGARFGRSLLGSSAFAGSLDPDTVRSLADADGVPLPVALAEYGVDVDTMVSAGEGRRERVAAYLELHIEQGPVLDTEGLSCAAVVGCFGVERHRVVFEGAAAHAGSTPMDRRRDAGVAAARTVVALQEVGLRHGGVCTAGRLDLEPGIATAVPGRAELLVDQRHLEEDRLAAMLSEARSGWEQAAAAEGCAVAAERIWGIEPIHFDPALVAAARSACESVAGSARELPSGALHDAAELARVAPAAMIFAPSKQGLSHAPGEDTDDRDLALAIEAFGELALGVVRG